MFLEDLHEGVTVNLRTNPSYSFLISDTVSTSRFLLHFGEKVAINNTNMVCFGEENGSIELEGKGTPPWNYEIIDLTNEDTIQAQNVFTPLSFNGYGSGVYEVSITNVNGECASVFSALTIGEAQEVVVEDQITNVQCYGEFSGAIQLDVNGGNELYSFNWNNGETQSVISGLAQGTYEVVGNG